MLKTTLTTLILVLTTVVQASGDITIECHEVGSHFICVGLGTADTSSLVQFSTAQAAGGHIVDGG